MRISVKKLMSIAEKALPPEQRPNMLFTYQGGRKRHAISASEMFAAFAEDGATAYSWCAAIEGYEQSREAKLVDILCQLVNGSCNIPVVKADSKQIYLH